MKGILRSTAMLSSSSFLAIITGLMTGKLSALWLGAAGIGFLGVFRSTMILGSLILGWGMSLGVTRIGAKLLADKNEASFTALIWTAYGTATIMVIIGFMVALIWGSTLVPVIYGHSGARYPFVLVWSMISIMGTLFSGITSGILRAHQTYIRALATASVVNVIMVFLFSLVALSTREVKWMFPVFAAASVSHALVLGITTKRHHLVPNFQPKFHDITTMARKLYPFCWSYSLSTLAGSGVQTLLPVLVLRWVGAKDLGYYIAAITVATQYLSFLTGAMGQEYLPRLSAEDRPGAIGDIIAMQINITLLIIFPIICLVISVAPFIIPLVYATTFKPTITLVQWMVAADVFRFGGWSITYALMAKKTGRYFFLTELFGGISTLVLSWVGYRLGGLTGIGWAYFGEYVMFAIFALVLGIRTLPITFASLPKTTIGISVGAVLLMRLLTLWGYNTVSVLGMTLVLLGTLIYSYFQLSRGWRLNINASSTSL